MTNPDNVGGLPTADQLYDIAADAWDQHQTNCRVTTTAGSLRKAVEAIHRELCRAAPAGGDPICPECKAPGLLFECVACSHSNYPKDSAPAGSGEVDPDSDAAFTLKMLEKLTCNGKDELMDDDGNLWGVDQIAQQAIKIIRWALLRKLQQGAAIPPHDAEEYRNIVFNPDERTSAIIRQAQAAGWNKCRAWLIAASQGQEGGHG